MRDGRGGGMATRHFWIVFAAFILALGCALAVCLAPAEAEMAASDTTTAAAPGEPTDGEKIVRRARSYLGTPYKYGTCTNTRMSCDCLVRKAYRAVGVTGLGHEGQMWRDDRFRNVARDELKKGDLIFFKPRGARFVTHVGIFSGRYEGRAYMIHASNYWRDTKVVEDPLKYIDRDYHGAKRLKR